MRTTLAISKVLWALLLPPLLLASANTSYAAIEHYALLVGCTEYPDPDMCPTLHGPVNDVYLWRRLLTAPAPNGFHYANENVKVLLGRAQSGKCSPTRANILRSLDSLIAMVKKDTQVFILFSGHGTQQPIPADDDPFDPADPEPDGLDEVFLPADARPGRSGIVNGLVDDDLGEKLAQLRAKGASVFVVFDCCHSGSMTRGAAGDEQTRSIPPSRTGIPQELFDAATNRARREAEARQLRPDAEMNEVDLVGRTPPQQGSLVAFFAAQAFEPAPELPLPVGAENVPANRYGLLSYTLVQTLAQRRGALSYRTLAGAVAAEYRKVRGTRFPTPFAEGDLHREVLGLQSWPIATEIQLRAANEEYSISAGSLHGIAKGTILAVLGEKDEVQGHVKVNSVFVNQSTVIPIVWGEVPPPTELKDDARCKIVFREYQDLQISLYIQDHRDRATLTGLNEETRLKVKLVDKPELGKWLLCRATPQLADQLKLPNELHGRVLLLPGEAALWNAAADSGDAVRNPLRVFGNYAPDSPELLAAMQRDLPRLFTWEGLWRVAADTASPPWKAGDVTVEASVLSAADDTVGRPLDQRRLQAGQCVKFVIHNTGPVKVWVNAFYLDADLGIRQLFMPQQLAANRKLEPIVIKLNTDGGSAGPEGVLVFAERVGDQKTIPSYAFLEQEPLKVPILLQRNVAVVHESSFGQVMRHLAVGDGDRGIAVEKKGPDVILHSWLLTE